jgi:hypothetical protein
VAVREIGRIGRIVRDYLDSTRSLEPERKPSSLRQILTEAVELSVGSDRGDGQPIEVVIDADPADFVTDPGLLRQIVINLLTNALDAIERGGRIVLSARVLTIRSSSRSTTTAPVSRPRTCAGSSSRSTPPRAGARAPAWAWPSAASWWRRWAGHRGGEHARRGIDLHGAAAAAGSAARVGGPPLRAAGARG